LDLELLEVIIGSAIADLDDSPESRDRLRVKLQRYVRKVFLYGREQIAAITFQGDSFARWCIVGPKGVLPPMPPPLPVALA
jgi:hypothetical protein